MSKPNRTDIIPSLIPWIGGVAIGSLLVYWLTSSRVQPQSITVTGKRGEFSINLNLKDGGINFDDLLEATLNSKSKDKVINDLNFRGFYELNDETIQMLQNKNPELLKNKIISLLKDYERPFTKRDHKFRNIESVEDMEAAVEKEIDYKSKVAEMLKYYARNYKGAFQEIDEDIKFGVSDTSLLINHPIAAACTDNKFYGKTIILWNKQKTSFYIVSVSAQRDIFECREGEDTSKTLLVNTEVGRCILQDKFALRGKLIDAKAKIISDTATFTTSQKGKDDKCKKNTNLN